LVRPIPVSPAPKFLLNSKGLLGPLGVSVSDEPHVTFGPDAAPAWVKLAPSEVLGAAVEPSAHKQASAVGATRMPAEPSAIAKAVCRIIFIPILTKTSDPSKFRARSGIASHLKRILNRHGAPTSKVSEIPTGAQAAWTIVSELYLNHRKALPTAVALGNPSQV
jgi:hypothetical protein